MTDCNPEAFKEPEPVSNMLFQINLFRRFGRTGKNIFFSLCIATLAIAGCGTQSETLNNHISRGKAYLESGNHEKARIEFKNAAQIDPRHAETYLLLGRTEEEAKNWGKALAYYTEALSLEPGNLTAHSRAGRINLFAGNLAAASEHAEAILASDSTNYDGLVLKASITAQKDDLDAAIEISRTILSSHPSSTEAISLLSNIYIRQNRLHKAVETLNEGLQHNADDTRLLVQLAQVYAAMSAMKEAEEILSTLISIEPDELMHYVNMSSFYGKQGRIDDGVAILRKAIDADPDDDNRYLLLAEFLTTHNKNTEAADVLSRALVEHSESNAVRFALARLHIKLGHPRDAYIEYKRLIEINGLSAAGLTARNELANGYFHNQHLDEAKELVNEVIAENPKDHDALLLRGKIALSERDFKSAIAVFRTELKEQPDSLEVANLLARAHILNNEPELATDVLNRGVQSHPDDTQIRFSLAQQLARSGKFDAALDHINIVLEKSGPQLSALLLKSELLMSKQDGAGALDALKVIQDEHPEYSEIHLKLGTLHQRLKNHQRAMDEYELGLKRSGKILPYMALITSVHVEQGQIREALARLNLEIERSPNEAVLHELLGETHISGKNYAMANVALNKAIALKPDWNLPYSSLAKMHLEQGKQDAAIDTYKRGLEVIPFDERLSTELAAVYENQNKHDKAIALYERVLTQNPNNDLATNNLATILTERKGGKESLARAIELADRFARSEQPVYLDTLGWAYCRSGDYMKSVRILQRAVELAPDVVQFNYHLGIAYYRLGDPSAEIYLSKALEPGLEFPGRQTAERAMTEIQQPYAGR